MCDDIMKVKIHKLQTVGNSKIDTVQFLYHIHWKDREREDDDDLTYRLNKT